MTITPLQLVRGICLVYGIGALLSATVLFPLTRRLVQTWLRLGKRIAGSRASEPPVLVTRIIESAVIFRAWQLLNAAIGLGCWWYLGTAHGAAFLTAALRQH